MGEPATPEDQKKRPPQRRVAVLSPAGKPLMPTKASRARRWLRQGIAEVYRNDLKQFAVRLLNEPSGDEKQDIALGIDPGSQFSGIGVQSAKATLFTAHLALPFKRVKARKKQQALLRRARRGRRIDRSQDFNKRAHRQKRFDNRRQAGMPPSIRANREMEYRVASEICNLFPIARIVYEKVQARTKPGCGFSPVMVGQKIMLSWLQGLAPVDTLKGWQTSRLRKHLGLAKDKANKARQVPETHANDGIALAASHFIAFESFENGKETGHDWHGDVGLTTAQFTVVSRPALYRRQLHFENPTKGALRKRKGGTVTPWGLRSCDYVQATLGHKVIRGWVGGYTDKSKQISLYDLNWKRLTKVAVSKAKLVQRSNGLCVA